MPVSVTEIVICESDRSAIILIRPFLGVNFTALLNRFQKICCKRFASPSTGQLKDSMMVSNLIRFASAAGRTESMAASITVARSTA